MLNPALPAGTRGLWWFAQGLENLGTVVTGPAVPTTGATYDAGGGFVLHDSQGEVTTLANAQAPLLPTAAVTFMLDLRGLDSTLRGLFCFKAGDSSDALRVVGPYPSSALVYWDFGGEVVGVTRLSCVWAKDIVRHVWAFTAGARGMEIWRDGVKVASNAATPTRTNLVGVVTLGAGGGMSDVYEYRWAFLHETQLAETLIQQISVDPASMLTVSDTEGQVNPHGGWRRRQHRKHWWYTPARA